MADLLARHLQGLLRISSEEQEKHEPVIDEFTISGISKYIKSDKCKRYFSYFIRTFSSPLNGQSCEVFYTDLFCHSSVDCSHS